MKNRRLNPSGSALAIIGIVIAAAVFFLSLWQTHPDPSRFQPGELPFLKLVLLEGRDVFECHETGEIKPWFEIPVDPQNEEEYIRFTEEHVFRKGRLEIRVIYIIAAGLLMFLAGLVLSFRRPGGRQ